MIKVILVKTDHTVKVIEVDGNLKSLQNAVGGYIECLGLNQDVHAYLDEEGKLKGKEPNAKATMLCRKLEIGLMSGDYIAGDMILLGSFDSNGDDDGGQYNFPKCPVNKEIFEEVLDFSIDDNFS